jgi:hypothetical protein
VRSKSFIVTVVVLLLVGGHLWHRWNEMANAPCIAPFPDARMGDIIVNRRMQLGKPPIPPSWLQTNSPPQPPSSQVPHDLGFQQKPNGLGNGEKTESTNSSATKP